MPQLDLFSFITQIYLTGSILIIGLLHFGLFLLFVKFFYELIVFLFNISRKILQNIRLVINVPFELFIKDRSGSDGIYLRNKEK